MTRDGAGAEQLLDEPDEASASDGASKVIQVFDRPFRVEDTRVFYDVHASTVEVLAIVSKAEAQAWLDDEGTPSAAGGPGGGQG